MNTPLVSRITITSAGAPNTTGGGREIPAFVSTPAMVGIGTTIANAINIDTNSNFFILLPPLALFYHFSYSLLRPYACSKSDSS
jgi:hypothetical protein